jgi:CheY-like chemotaxis protein
MRRKVEPMVLVVEEDDEVRDSISDLLTERGYLAVSTRTTGAARALLGQGFRPRVILLDPFTPNGAQQFKTDLHADPLLKRTPVIVGPGGLRKDPKMQMTLPREHHLRGPLDVKALLHIVHSYCRY